MLNETGFKNEIFSVNAFAKQKGLVDVVVIGAGPAGSICAGEITKKGFNVLLIEKDAFPGQTNVCAGGIERGIVAEFGLRGLIEKEISIARYHFPWGEEEYKVNFVSVKREVFDSFLAHQAVDAGAQLLINTVVRDAILENDCVKLKVKSRGGESEIRTKLVVFADGPNTLAHNFGIGFEIMPDTVSESSIFEIEWKNNPLDGFEYFFSHEISPWGYGWIFPKKDTLNIGVICLYSKLEKNILEYLKNFRSNLEKPVKEKRITRFTSALVPLVPARRIYGERMLVVGDAAGMVDPLSGGGISYAIRGGKVAAKVALDVLKEGTFSKVFLSRYQNEWERTEDYRNIKKRYHLSNIFLPLSKIDKNIFSKMVGIRLNKRGTVRKLLCRNKLEQTKINY
jgi:digeranylgeranylglycerophospholipid reductase